ncbi:hypothetical protein [Phreatobacter oligotrophus]|uniref:Uncharacterized protein n=1 Tax=Phreatobacter oligotrophus TaxID=1122261 RepID=A0A2T4Z2H6_9HYPH|nr:hypothetical protein [Phreatobacter oligotrophus]PTM54951.1 hypothetical protein C8P69_105101 [Phreatobacter oligotrophus]
MLIHNAIQGAVIEIGAMNMHGDPRTSAQETYQGEKQKGNPEGSEQTKIHWDISIRDRRSHRNSSKIHTSLMLH